MSISDRRNQSRQSHSKNRAKLLERNKKRIRDTLDKVMGDMNVKGKNKITITPGDDSVYSPPADKYPIDRPYTAPGGNEKKGDSGTMRKPPAGGGGGLASNSGEGQDSFKFIMTDEEIREQLFEMLELPNLKQNCIAFIDETVRERAGFSRTGPFGQLDVYRSYSQSFARRLASKSLRAKELERLHKLQEEEPSDQTLKMIEALEQRKAPPFFDEKDLRFRHFEDKPILATHATMFCIMDVSGSMTKRDKDLAKRFFIALAMFLRYNYKKVDIRFIRYHTSARECGEQEFFESQETGGTVIANAYQLVKDEIDKIPPHTTNIYLCHASDGDVWDYSDNRRSIALIEDLLQRIRFLAYAQIGPVRSDINFCKVIESFWGTHPDVVRGTYLNLPEDIWSALFELFGKDDDVI